MLSRELRLLLWLLFVHIAGLFLFTKGFLLSRLALPHHSSSSSSSSLSTHTRAIVLIIDALRYDFISPSPPSPSSPYHHHILTLPYELTSAHPERSFIFNAYADPPTTTLQRIKGLTTGSLPTFVDAGESFGGSAIREDSVMHQLDRAGKKVALVGDNTWQTLFPDILDLDLSFPYDSFNVEDLHTVDEGVIQHLLPLISHPPPPPSSSSWTLAIGHGLGVDHIGHRLGPDHPLMASKLHQMNILLSSIVNAMHNDTLLIVLGDHGMDRTGNHGGDSTLETMSAMWVYSKGPALSHAYEALPESVLEKMVFPGERVAQRYIQQIDLVPTLSLLLGLPIPFNNLGSVIPELFNRRVEGGSGSGVREALQVNARQIKRYLDAYRASPSKAELDGAWSELSDSWSEATNTMVGDALTLLYRFNRLALSTCRALWAQFNMTLMVAGLVVIASSIAAAYAVYTVLGDAGERWEEVLDAKVAVCWRAGGVGLVLGGAVHLMLRSFADAKLSLLHTTLFSSATASNAALILTTPSSFHIRNWSFAPTILLLHALCFASNSFVVWEDRAVLFLLQTSLVPSVLVGFTAPTTRLRYRILGFSALFAICVRLMAMSTVCREEQHPYCTVTFYASPTSSAPPLLAVVLAPLMAIAIPRFVVPKVLGISRSEGGVAGVLLPWVVCPAMLAGSVFWMVEAAEVTGWVGSWARTGRTGLAVGVVLFAVVGMALWWAVPVCLDIQTVEGSEPRKKQVTILGFANAFGSPYLVFWMILVSVVWVCTQLMGQVVFGLAVTAVLAYLEVADSVRDVYALNEVFASSTPNALSLSNFPTPSTSPPLTFTSLTPLALLGTHLFYSTGHQPTIPSLQWKSAFVLCATLDWPREWVARATVGVNTFGGVGVVAVAGVLVGLWNVAPGVPLSSPSPSSSTASPKDTTPTSISTSPLRASLALSTYYATLALSTALCATVLRRHLMVWKVFAPRYAFAAGMLGVVDLAVGVGVGVAWGRVRLGVRRVLGAGVSGQERVRP
ncbi:hypothetical protein F5I97DRAFT_1004935 [Phlebopus sp. FC_14]|nr:hypothetical protein F5I97DRAFT_1004935 [Phlebopus sp. FC_14]